MENNDLKKEIRWFWKTQLDRSKKQEKDPEEKVPELNSGERKQNRTKIFKGMCKNCVRYGHRAAIERPIAGARWKKQSKNPLQRRMPQL